jgi:non-ribosomal peptide synthetase component F
LAFCCGQDSLSYNELNVKTKQVATYLINAGVQKGDRIGIYMDRCIETAIAVYGIMKAGASYVPLDPSAPHSRTSFLVDDCGIKHLLTTKKQDKRISAIIDLQPNIKSTIGNTLSLAIPTISWKEIFEISITDYKPVKILESDLAYIMYTSGSTGTPKGIMHTHHSGLTFAKLSAQVYGLNFEDRVANHAPLHFDISTFGYFSAPLASATTVIIPDD